VIADENFVIWVFWHCVTSGCFIALGARENDAAVAAARFSEI
jgi:hypothetical protein